MTLGSKYQIDMCHGPLFPKIVLFGIPLMIANTMQFLFNAVDLIVVGRYGSRDAMAAVGSCGSLITMFMSVFFGLSMGANVLVARYIGAERRLQIFRSVHTAIAIALYGGTAVGVIGCAASGSVLKLMQLPPSVFARAVPYMRLFCVSIPFILLYNFGSSILRATGDTRRPLMFMLISGFAKTMLNLFLVRVFHWDVEGVATATIIANMISSALVLLALARMKDACRLYFRRIRFFGSNFIDNLKIGIPAGIQSALFGISNVIIQSTVNTFGPEAIAGNAAAGSLESIVYVAFISYYYAVISFVGQNHGAKKYKRIVKSILICMFLGMLSSAIIGVTMYHFDVELLGIYNPASEVVRWGQIRLKYLVLVYFLCALMEVLNGALRGLGHSLTPMIVTMMGACVLRVFWVFWIFPRDPTLNNLLLSYPVSWILTSAVNGGILYWICRRLFHDVVESKRHLSSSI